VILANDLDTLLPCTIVAKIKSRKLVFDAHEYFTEVPELIGRSSIKKVWQKVASWCIPHANVCYTVSDNLARIFEEKYKKHFYIIRNVPLMHELIDGHNTHHDKPIIIYQGDLNVGRGIEETMHAIVNKDVEYWIAGDGPIKEHLQKRIKELDINNKVKLLGYLTPDELRKCTSKADVGINLLQPQSLSYYYSLSNKFFNYMHAGVPQICAPFPEYEVINNHCRIAVFANCNATEISDAIDILLKDKNLYQQLKTNCFKASKMYHWEEEKNKLISIYQTLN
jgi:glycosyltransferase involved in cell wall biosynthesis